MGNSTSKTDDSSNFVRNNKVSRSFMSPFRKSFKRKSLREGVSSTDDIKFIRPTRQPNPGSIQHSMSFIAELKNRNEANESSLDRNSSVSKSNAPNTLPNLNPNTIIPRKTTLNEFSSATTGKQSPALKKTSYQRNVRKNDFLFPSPSTIQCAESYISPQDLMKDQQMYSSELHLKENLNTSVRSPTNSLPNSLTRPHNQLSIMNHGAHVSGSGFTRFESITAQTPRLPLQNPNTQTMPMVSHNSQFKQVLDVPVDINPEIVMPSYGEQFVAVKDVRGDGTAKLNVKLHEKLEFLMQAQDTLWFMKSCVTGLKGLIESNNLIPFISAGREVWFFDGIGRKEAESCLKDAGKHGTYLVRNSESKPGEYAISLLDGDLVKHYKIREDHNGGFFISAKQKFGTLQELVDFYSRSSDEGLCARLAIPCAKISKRTLSEPFPDDAWELNRDDLTIGGILGKGHFGLVREGYLQKTHRVAIKELKRGHGVVSEFQTEVNALKELRHERLLSLTGVCTQKQPFLIVTEFMVNGSLLEYLKGPNGKHLEFEELLHISLQVAEGMEYLESMSYIHRDLAARNVLLDDRLNIRIADFGLAKLVKEETMYTLSENTAKVPIKWTALEALLHGEFSSKSDVWSFGILLAEIITRGMTPYKELNNSEILEFLKKGNRLKQEPYIDDRYYNLMLECWARNPLNRPNFNQLRLKLTDYIRDVKENGQKKLLAVEDWI